LGVFKEVQLNLRLPDNIKPILYDFKIKPYIGRNAAWPAEKDFTFEGSIEMHFKCVKPTTEIVFHAADMIIDASSLTIRSDTDATMTVSKSIKNETLREFVTVTMSKQCTANADYVLSMTYEGEVLPALYGFYRSSYINELGETV
jgi:hypothetical protein